MNRQQWDRNMHQESKSGQFWFHVDFKRKGTCDLRRKTQMRCMRLTKNKRRRPRVNGGKAEWLLGENYYWWFRQCELLTREEKHLWMCLWHWILTEIDAGAKRERERADERMDRTKVVGKSWAFTREAQRMSFTDIMFYQLPKYCSDSWPLKG